MFYDMLSFVCIEHVSVMRRITLLMKDGPPLNRPFVDIIFWGTRICQEFNKLKNHRNQDPGNNSDPAKYGFFACTKKVIFEKLRGV